MHQRASPVVDSFSLLYLPSSSFDSIQLGLQMTALTSMDFFVWLLLASSSSLKAERCVPLPLMLRWSTYMENQFAHFPSFYIYLSLILLLLIPCRYLCYFPFSFCSRWSIDFDWLLNRLSFLLDVTTTIRLASTIIFMILVLSMISCFGSSFGSSFDPFFCCTLPLIYSPVLVVLFVITYIHIKIT